MKQYIGTKIIQAGPGLPAATLQGAMPELGYKVVYPDGYESWSPKAAFEEAYRPCDAMTFGLALEALKKGLRVARAGWNGKGLWLEYIKPAHEVDLPFIRMSYPVNSATYPQGARVPWMASQTDMLAEDWVLLP